jgi:hypothetical protein
MRDYSKLGIQDILIHEINYFKTQGRKIKSITLGHNDYQELMYSFDGTSIVEVGSIETSFHGITIRLAKKAKNLIRVNCKKDIYWAYALGNPNWVSKNKIDWSGIPLDLFAYGQNKLSSTLL